MACFIVLISCTVPTPSSCARNSFFPIPTPCSPVPERSESISDVSLVYQQHINLHVPSIAIARSTIRWTAAFTFGNSSSPLNKSNAWKFPIKRRQSLAVPQADHSTIPDVPNDCRLYLMLRKILLGFVHQLWESGHRDAGLRSVQISVAPAAHERTKRL